MKFFAAVLFVCFVQSALSQRVSNGQCGAVTAASGLTNDDVLGAWFGIFKYNFQPTSNTKCNYGCYSLQGDQLSVVNHYVSTESGEAGQNAPLVGKFDSNNGQFEVTINGQVSHFTVLAYDAKLGAGSLYSCDNVGTTQKRENIFGISRSRTPSAEAIAFMKSGFTNQGVSLDNTFDEDQSNCPAATC